MVCKKAFTLIELLVVIAIIAMVTAMLLPVVSRAKVTAQRTVCLSNMAELNLGCKMYTDDNGGELVSSWPTDATTANNVNAACWCPGWASTLPPPAGRNQSCQYSCTNPYALQQGKIWPYMNSANVYRCPADARTVNGLPVVRSFSMNSWLNGSSQGDPTGVSTYFTPQNDLSLTYTLFRREGQILQPSAIWRLIEADASTIGDSMFMVDLGVYNQTADLPSTRHDNTYTLTFMDGHSEAVALRASVAQWDKVVAGGADPDWLYLKSITTFTNKSGNVEALRHSPN
jgi:prepilin-type N-terminal cleavage/methylation domain-containing protein